jgi:hypothetical protein
MRRFSVVSSLILLAALIGLVAAPRSPKQAPNVRRSEIVASATEFLGMLDAAERAKAAFPFDSPQKTNWSNLPSGIYQRNSLRLGDLNANKRAAVMTLLAAALSADGYKKVNDIMNVTKRRGANWGTCRCSRTWRTGRAGWYRLRQG